MLALGNIISTTFERLLPRARPVRIIPALGPFGTPTNRYLQQSLKGGDSSTRHLQMHRTSRSGRATYCTAKQGRMSKRPVAPHASTDREKPDRRARARRKMRKLDYRRGQRRTAWSQVSGDGRFVSDCLGPEVVLVFVQRARRSRRGAGGHNLVVCITKTGEEVLVLTSIDRGT